MHIHQTNSMTADKFYLYLDQQTQVIKILSQTVTLLFKKFFLWYIGVKLINSVLIVSGAQRRDSAIHIYMCINSWSSDENATEQESKFVFFLILKNVVRLILMWTQAEHIILGS